MSDFVHLHVHSHFSLLNGLTKIKPLVKAFKKRGFKAATLTDYGSMYGAIKFYEECLKQDIKPIIGFEAFVAPRSMHDKDPEKDKDVYNIILLAENYDGYRNLMKITSEGHLHGFFNEKPRVDKELLKTYSKNIIALSGPIEGEIQQLLLKNKIEEAKRVALEYNEIFGQDNFYLELQDHPAIEGQLSVNTKLIELSKDTGIPLVVTRDVHYLDPEHAEAQDILLCIGKGWKVGYTNREDYRHVDRSLNTGDDIASRFRHVKEAIENTGKIADRINIEIELNNWHFAPVDLPEGKTADDHLRDESYRLAPSFYPDMGSEVSERIDYELDIIKTKGYSPYFICVADYVEYAKANGIVESTRGSAAGSLVSFVLGITTVDPLRFKLPFERFLNPFRPSPPDIDTDFADDRREEMIEYVTKKYGADRVAQIITFGTMAARASVRDVGRALGFSYSFCDQVAKLIPQGAQGFPMTVKRAIDEEPDLGKLYETNDDVKKLLNFAQTVEGCARHTSIHAAGVVISPTPLTDFTPIQRESGGDKIVTQFEMKTVEAAGVLKNDFLGIRNLAILGNAVEIVKATTGDDVDIYNLPLDDALVFEMLARGETMGVFQLSGSGMTRWLKELKPNRIEDIMAMVALYRPGPMEAIPEYIHRKYNPEAVKYLDPRLEEILSASYGLLVYQDDVMLTAMKLAGYNWMEADKFRKAMGKKIPEEMAKQKEKFFKGCKEIGKVPQDIINELWRAIEPFAAYGFNKAHAASYGIVAYQTAFMKAHYPVQFMTSVLKSEFGDSEKVSAIVNECNRMGIKVLPPDVNESFKNFAMVSKQGEDGRIRFGLNAVKNVGANISEVIFRERKEHGKYTSLENILERVQHKDMNKKSVESLVKVGAFDAFGYDRGVLLNNTENILNFLRHLKENAITNQGSLFSGTAIDIGSKVTLKSSPDATMIEKLNWEKDLLGIYVSSHPLTPFETALEGAVSPIIESEDHPRDEWIVLGGVIDKLTKKITKKGSIMMFVTLQDRSGSVELLVFPKKYEETKFVWEERKVVCVVGKTPRDSGDNKVFVENVYTLTKENAEQIARQVQLGKATQGGKDRKKKKERKKKVVTLLLSQEEVKEFANPLKEVFEKFVGDIEVYVRVGSNMIKTQARVDNSEAFQEKVEEVIGKGKILIGE
ncbi:MAG: DNA polymerase III subunit alpha [Candidatus Magasanikbacteria bacterium]|jgi:DNA polymerase III subunit alpha|nr:DNA polymerase III subunit alpha [Candidatus Magasanikbacteria bacterium]MBT4221172.1 DNA polymerase III subunit alpha [Candidatus Magasanikbacteria bacterium]MBT4350258.1 DNA polymerase III subunit alpha [Candidatus Magasanikbacteria bacterium]MBT4541685.1 DNA polymerase III subunit alpha [Candidatus Magasanikbacteria bacterium]MBT6253339.1 DNA polymerase III subunit alpha [Candidatus Magasanikbacteria bacterium]